MTNRLVAIAYNVVADPRQAGGEQGEVPPHLVREEIPAIEEALRQRGWDFLTIPVREDILEAAQVLRLRSPWVVLNLCEDLLGDSAHEMHFTALLELMGLPYSGSPPLSLGLCRDKAKTKNLLRQQGIPTPEFVLAEKEDFPLNCIRYPLIVKPATEDGSLGIDDECVVHDEAALRQKVSELLEDFEGVLVEEFVEGRELNVALLGNSPTRPLPVSEIDFSGLPGDCPKICGYEAKWEQEDARYKGTAPICPAPVGEKEKEALERYSLAAFRVLGLRDYARIDWRLSPTRGPQFLEANPNPDISPASGFMRALRAAGLDYPDLVDLLIAAARERKS